MGGYLHRPDLAALIEGQRPKVRDMSTPPTLPLINRRPIMPVDFPVYVPEGARQWAMDFLGTDATVLEYLIGERADTNNSIRQCPNQDKETLIGLHKRLDEVTSGRDYLLAAIAVKHRMIYDDCMKAVYLFFATDCFEDDQAERERKIYGFLDAAWSARMDYGEFREVVRKAKSLKPEIAKTASALSALLRQAEATGLYPREFYDLASLLRQADNPDNSSWKLVREKLLGAPWVAPWEGGMREPSDPSEQAHHDLGVNWLHAPSLPTLLASLANAAQQYDPKERGHIGAALSSPKANPSSEYIRAFGHLLAKHRFTLSGPILTAIGITAGVMLNNPDIAPSYDDVSKAIALLRRKSDDFL